MLCSFNKSKSITLYFFSRIFKSWLAIITVPCWFKKFKINFSNNCWLGLSNSLVGSSNIQKSISLINEKYSLARAALFFRPSEHSDINKFAYFTKSKLFRASLKFSSLAGHPFIDAQDLRFSIIVKSLDKPFLVSIKINF